MKELNIKELVIRDESYLSKLAYDIHEMAGDTTKKFFFKGSGLSRLLNNDSNIAYLVGDTKELMVISY